MKLDDVTLSLENESIKHELELLKNCCENVSSLTHKIPFLHFNSLNHFCFAFFIRLRFLMTSQNLYFHSQKHILS